MELNWNFLRRREGGGGVGVKKKKLSMRGVRIFSETAHSVTRQTLLSPSVSTFLWTGS